MKKLLAILALMSALFLTACGDSSSSSSSDSSPSVVYDFSSREAMDESFKAQAKKEGFTEKEANQIARDYMMIITMENIEEVQVFKANSKSKKEEDIAAFKFIEKYAQGKTIKEMQEYVELNK